MGLSRAGVGVVSDMHTRLMMALIMIVSDNPGLNRNPNPNPDPDPNPNPNPNSDPNPNPDPNPSQGLPIGVLVSSSPEGRDAVQQVRVRVRPSP